MKFTQSLKIYLFKDRGTVDLSVRVTDELVHGYKFSIAEFETIVNDWQSGVNMDLKHGHIFIEYKKNGPRPESMYAPYVRFSVHANNMVYHHRLTFDDMYGLTKEYSYQKNNVMYWD
jgi:hypothetical protein